MSINATLILQLIAFIFFVAFCMKYVWPPIINAIEQRQKLIADSLNKAEQVQSDVENLKQIADKQIEEAKQKALEILAQAKESRDEILKKAYTEADLEKNRIISEGLVELQNQTNKAKQQLQEKYAELVALGVLKIIEKNIDLKADAKMLEKIVSKL